MAEQLNEGLLLTMKKIFFGIVSIILLLAVIGCQLQPIEEPVAMVQTPQSTEQPTTQPIITEAPLEQIVVSIDTEVTEAPTAAPTPEPTAEPTATPTPTPSPTPVTTRAPMEGDVTTAFPNYDTGTDADYSYQSDELRIAVRKTVDEELQQVYYVADIWMRNVNCFRTGFGRGTFNTGTEDGEKFATREHAVLAVNGSVNYGLVIHNRVKTKGVQRNIDYKGICILYEDGTMQVFDIEKDRFNLNNEEKKGVVNAWQFGPVLVKDGEIAGKFATFGTRHPRIMIGYYEPGHYVVVAVDGRSKKAIGMNNYEMAELMYNLGCKEAMNLDGGTSAMMVFMGECISNPSGVDTDGDGKAGRNLHDMLLFAEYDRDGNAPALEDIDLEKVTIR